MNLPKLNIEIKKGIEQFHENGKGYPFSLIDFWRWSVSDLISNATRGRLAEFIVATALKIPLTTIRDEWSTWDLTTPENIRVEVKSASYIQSWFQKELSKISFSIQETKAWDAETNAQDNNSKRQAQVYVFALLAHQDKSTIDPLNLSQWKFFVLSTEILNREKGSQRSITLQSLEMLCKPVTYSNLQSTVIASMRNI